jgi:predicted alpha/beta superfamily hydrolase
VIVREVEALKKRPRRLRIWLDTGTKEGGNEAEAAETTANARALRDALLAKGWKDLKYFEAEGSEHNERAWEQRVGPMLKFLFPRR